VYVDSQTRRPVAIPTEIEAAARTLVAGSGAGRNDPS
jgi:acyl-CoA thioester hydrolase